MGGEKTRVVVVGETSTEKARTGNLAERDATFRANKGTGSFHGTLRYDAGD